MDAAADPTPRSRFKSRNRYPPRIHSHQRLLAPQLDRPDAPPVDARRDAARATKEKMTRAHRFFHRRAAQANTKIVTVAVEVVAEVDGNGSLVAQETLAPVTLQASHDAVIPAPAAPTVPALPTVSAVPNVPAVPTVPAVPSVLAVPAIPTMPAVPSVVPAAQLPLPSAAQLPAAPVLPAVPAVPVVSAVPAPALPSVPAVPPFPDNLHVPSVPGYPFSTGVPLAQVATPSAAVPVSSIPPTGPQGTATPPVAPTPAPISAISSAGNATISSSTLLLASSSLASLDSISASTASELIATIAAAPPRSASSSASTLASVSTSASPLASQSLPSSIRTPSMQTSNSFQSTRTTATTSQPASTTAYYPGGYGGGGETPGMAPAPAATTSAAAGTNSTPSALETPKVVGSVVGSLAGAALILALILLLLQRHKRKRGGALQLTGDDHTDTNRSVTNRSMSQAPATGSTLIPASFLHRFSGLSGKTGETNLSGGERSFQRVSGRKLPSAFSEGLTSDQFSGGGTMSGSSFYQDDQGTYGGPGASKDFGKEIGKEVGIPTITRESGQMNIRPSPARTPIIKHPDDGNPFASDQDFLSPPQSPNPELPARGSLGRSLHSADGSRSSRFTENV